MIDLEGAATDIQCAEQQKYDTNEHRVRHACRMNHLQEAYWGKRPNEVSTVPHTPLTPGQSQAGQHCHGVGTHPLASLQNVCRSHTIKRWKNMNGISHWTRAILRSG
jgi:hypothetical protein